MILSSKKSIFSLVLILFCLLGSVRAVPLSSYRQKMQEINESVSYLNYPEEYLSEVQNIAQQRHILQVIRTKLPATEKIELSGTTIEVNHGWIMAKLEEFENEQYQSAKRRLITEELSEQLSTLVVKLTELENLETGLRTKDQEKQKLDEILKRPEYQKPAQEETWLQKKWREFWEWLWRVTPKPERQIRNSAGSPLISTTLLYLIIAAALVLIGFLIYRFGPSLVSRIRTRNTPETRLRVILGETIAAETTAHNIFSEAEDLARKGNLREAIRRGYIAFLCELSDRKLIGLVKHKTNRDYLRDVRKRKDIHRNMNELTQNFEQNWYGSRKTGERDWEDFKRHYEQAVSGES